MLPGTGPYMVAEQDVNKGNSVRIRKRNDYWAEKHRRNVGTNNFVRSSARRSRRQPRVRVVKRGDLDSYVLTAPSSGSRSSTTRTCSAASTRSGRSSTTTRRHQGIAINTRREPYNDIRVRKALRHLFNRELMIQKLTFNEYVPMDSIFSGQRVRESEQREDQVRPSAGAEAARRGWMEGSRLGRDG